MLKNIELPKASCGSYLIFEEIEAYLHSVDRKLERAVAPLFQSDSRSNKQSCLNLLRTIPFYLIGQRLVSSEMYAIAGICLPWLACRTSGKVDIPMKLLQAIGTAFFLDALVKVNFFLNNGSHSAALLISIDLVYSAVYFYFSARHERDFRQQLRERFLVIA